MIPLVSLLVLIDRMSGSASTSRLVEDIPSPALTSSEIPAGALPCVYDASVVTTVHDSFSGPTDASNVTVSTGGFDGSSRNPGDQAAPVPAHSLSSSMPAKIEETQVENVGGLAALKPFDPAFKVQPAVAKYTHEMLLSIGTTLARLVSNQLHMDQVRAFSAPRLEHDGERIVDTSIMKDLPIGALLFQTKTARIFEVRDDPSRIVKYFHNCRFSDEVHPLMRDFIFLRKLENLHVAPRAHFLSPPVRVPESSTLKSAFGITPAERAACAADENGHIRFMVMERARTSLDALARNFNRQGRRLSVRLAIKIMVNTVRAIESIHKRGVIHGDIHWGNVVMMDRGGQRIIELIDFGNAMFADEMKNLPAIIRVPGSYNHCFFSHWNLGGYRFSYRDDVYKALLVGAFLINGPKFESYCASLESDFTAMMSFKRDSFLFAMPNRDHIAEMTVDEDTKRVVHTALSNALKLARDVGKIDELPNYDGILQELMSAVDALEVSHNVGTSS